jgi:hypothetical protein
MAMWEELSELRSELAEQQEQEAALQRELRALRQELREQQDELRGQQQELQVLRQAHRLQNEADAHPADPDLPMQRPQQQGEGTAPQHHFDPAAAARHDYLGGTPACSASTPPLRSRRKS